MFLEGEMFYFPEKENEYFRIFISLPFLYCLFFIVICFRLVMRLGFLDDTSGDECKREFLLQFNIHCLFVRFSNGHHIIPIPCMRGISQKQHNKP